MVHDSRIRNFRRTTICAPIAAVVFFDIRRDCDQRTRSLAARPQTSRANIMERVLEDVRGEIHLQMVNTHLASRAIIRDLRISDARDVFRARAVASVLIRSYALNQPFRGTWAYLAK
jgi:hypothetical protein